MEGVTIVEHPLVQHKLTLMRDKDRSTKGFRELLHEIGMLLCYEITRDLPLELIDVETPMAHMRAPGRARTRDPFHAPPLSPSRTVARSFCARGRPSSASCRAASPRAPSHSSFSPASTGARMCA